MAGTGDAIDDLALRSGDPAIGGALELAPASSASADDVAISTDPTGAGSDGSTTAGRA